MALVSGNSSVASTLLFLVLLPQKVRLHTQHPWHADCSQEQQENLKRALSSKHLGFTNQLAVLVLGTEGTRREEHENEHVEKPGRWDARRGPVGDPFENDADNEITKDGLEEQDLGNELGPDVEWFLEVKMIRDLKANRKGHLYSSIC